MNEELMQILESVDAVRKGHFLLSSGNHSDIYFQMALALQHYDIAMDIAERMAEDYSGEMVDVVIGPAVGAIVLAHEVARAMEARAIFAERDSEGRMKLRRGFEIMPDEKVVIVEDVFTTGGSVSEIAELVKGYDGYILGISSIVNRSGKKSPKIKGIQVRSLISVKAEMYKPENCPLCSTNQPLVKPGSKKKF